MAKNIYTLLDELSIHYDRVDHVPVFTSDQARALIPKQPAASAKNLFLRDKKGKNHFLLVFDDQKTLDFGQLASQVGLSRLSLASPARLKALLGVEPGAVSLLALINDHAHKVQLLFDRELWDEDFLQCHPLVNTSTLIIAMLDIKRFIEEVGHEAFLVDVQ